MRPACSVEGCDRPNVARTWCDAHYKRFRATGDPLGSLRSAPQGDSECSVDGCSTPAKSRGWCGRHYQVWNLHGDVNYKRPTAQDSPCTVDGCQTKVHSRGLCSMHYRRNRIHGDPNAAWVNRAASKICTVDDCDKPQQSRTWCSKHYQVWLKHGDASYVRPATRGIDIPHGTLTGYGWHGCRCADCAAVQATSSRKGNLKKYGITPADYDRMLDEQGGVCAICRREGSVEMYGRLMAVDHCHDTGRVRGLLCTACNTSIGQMQDDPNRLMAAAAYLLQNTDVLGEVSK